MKCFFNTEFKSSEDRYYKERYYISAALYNSCHHPHISLHYLTDSNKMKKKTSFLIKLLDRQSVSKAITMLVCQTCTNRWTAR